LKERAGDGNIRKTNKNGGLTIWDISPKMRRERDANHQQFLWNYYRNVSEK
jgi:hypothetical protein